MGGEQLDYIVAYSNYSGDEIALSLTSEIAKLHNSSQLRSYMNYYNH